MVTFLAPSALASASRSASSEPSLSWADLAPEPVAAGVGTESAARARGIGPAADRAATTPTATAMRARRLWPGMGSRSCVWVIGIPRVKERADESAQPCPRRRTLASVDRNEMDVWGKPAVGYAGNRPEWTGIGSVLLGARVVPGRLRAVAAHGHRAPAAGAVAGRVEEVQDAAAAGARADPLRRPAEQVQIVAGGEPGRAPG